jgi:hypothetical protein
MYSIGKGLDMAGSDRIRSLRFCVTGHDFRDEIKRRAKSFYCGDSESQRFESDHENGNLCSTFDRFYRAFQPIGLMVHCLAGDKVHICSSLLVQTSKSFGESFYV